MQNLSPEITIVAVAGIAAAAGFIIGASLMWLAQFRINNEKKVTKSFHPKEIAHHHSN